MIQILLLNHEYITLFNVISENTLLFGLPDYHLTIIKLLSSDFGFGFEVNKKSLILVFTSVNNIRMTTLPIAGSRPGVR